MLHPCTGTIVSNSVRMQCSAVQCIALYCSTVQCSEVQCTAVQCSAVQWSAVQCSAVLPLSPPIANTLTCPVTHCHPAHYSALYSVQCTAVQYCAVRCNTARQRSIQCSVLYICCSVVYCNVVTPSLSWTIGLQPLVDSLSTAPCSVVQCLVQYLVQCKQ